jgi:hypothetical protein
MNMLDYIIPFAISSITGVVGWLVGRTKQKNDFLADLQSSINLLSEENKKLLERVVKLSIDKANLEIELAAIKAMVFDLQKQIIKIK